MPELVIRGGEAESFGFDWGAIKWLCNGTLLPGTELTFGVVWIRPGDSNPLHYHPNCEELLYVLSGECTHRLGEEVYHLKPGDLIRVPANVVHRAEASGWEPLQAIVVFDSPDRQTVVVEG